MGWGKVKIGRSEAAKQRRSKFYRSKTTGIYGTNIPVRPARHPLVRGRVSNVSGTRQYGAEKAKYDAVRQAGLNVSGTRRYGTMAQA